MSTLDAARDKKVSGCESQPGGKSSQLYGLNGSELYLMGTADADIAHVSYYGRQTAENE